MSLLTDLYEQGKDAVENVLNPKSTKTEEEKKKEIEEKAIADAKTTPPETPLYKKGWFIATVSIVLVTGIIAAVYFKGNKTTKPIK